jgi:cytochrome c biogenesis protein
MATGETNMTGGEPEARLPLDAGTSAAVGVASQQSESTGSGLGEFVDAVLRLLSSVRFGLVMLGTLLACCLIGMLIMQISVEGFQKYYNNLSPAKKAVYGSLGFFDIYHAWYFSLLLAITGLNIILASIDRFPTAWQYLRKPKLTASPKFIKAQMYATELSRGGSADGVELSEAIGKKWRKAGYRVRVTPSDGRITVFAQKFAWNRLGAYAVHVALLTIFTGGFLTNKYGAGGSMEIEPGKSSDRFSTLQYAIDGPRAGMLTLPFKIECLDLQQKLVRPEGGLDAQNTIDWLSSIRIDDKGKQKDILVHLNNVGDYKGYRFFQSQFSPIASARQIVVSFEPITGGQAVTVTIKKNEAVDVPGVGRVRFVAFYPDFEVTDSAFTPLQGGEYVKPFAQLEVMTPDGERHATVALGPQATALFDQGNGSSSVVEKELLVNGKRAVLKDFEKVSRAHTLTIQYDPGRTPVYAGFVLLLLSLCSVFFFAHQRVWAVVEPAGQSSKIYLGGNVNRNRQGFEETFNKMVALAESAST